MRSPLKILPVLIAGGLAVACASVSPRDRTDEIADSISRGTANIAGVSALGTPFGLFYVTANRTGIDSSRKGKVKLKGGRIKPAVGQSMQRAEDGSVSVTIYSDPPLVEEAQEAAELAVRILAAGTQKLWPKEPSPIRLALIVHDPGAGKFRSSVRRKAAGAPWKLEFYVHPDFIRDAPDEFAGERNLRSSPGATAAHELYHLMARERRIGRTNRGSFLPKSTRRILEEAAAKGYGHCAQILAGEAADARATPGLVFTAVREDGATEKIDAPFPDWALRHIVSMLEQKKDTNYILHMGVSLTIWMDISDGSFFIEPGTPQADRLLSFCELTAPNPDRVLDWLKDIASDGEDARISTSRSGDVAAE